ncbi:hypothetical protein LFML04_0957 [Leptospirillum ferriphilum ML-04]|uniref:Uncharacterized protein n=1 Tax=Leptospirillum ferriphilum (strain ML-04) TaxID=1048260 RepID=J9Z9L0_LEPFM|nr:hypothetical protein LFML04_0957 [Leptospirillum ferriphilum ML-04]
MSGTKGFCTLEKAVLVLVLILCASRKQTWTAHGLEGSLNDRTC